MVGDVFKNVLNSFPDEYFELLAKSGGEELWKNRNVLYDSEYDTERKYEYARVNYGNFEIIYSIQRPMKFVISERYINKRFLFFKEFDKISVVEKHATLAKLYFLFIIVVLFIVFLFIKGRPARNK
jgi:hypothetical protein